MEGGSIDDNECRGVYNCFKSGYCTVKARCVLWFDVTLCRIIREAGW